jgi:hypothetical protein
MKALTGLLRIRVLGYSLALDLRRRITVLLY